MALIKCPECGKEISDKATSCPNCGCPISDVKNQEVKQEKEQSEEKPKQEVNYSQKYRSEKPKKNHNTLRIVISVLIILSGIAMGNVFSFLIAVFSAFILLPISDKYIGSLPKVFRIIGVVVIFYMALIVSAIFQSDGNKEQVTETNIIEKTAEVSVVETEEESTEPPIEYIQITAAELQSAVENNALKAANDYKGQYLEITGKLGTIDSSGKYIGMDSDEISFIPIHCNIKSDEQKEFILSINHGDSITVKGYCKDVGEILGYSINIDSIE